MAFLFHSGLKTFSQISKCLQVFWSTLSYMYWNWILVIENLREKNLSLLVAKIIALNLNNVDLNASASMADKLIAKAILVY